MESNLDLDSGICVVIFFMFEQILRGGCEKTELPSVRQVQEESSGDGESDNHGGAVREGFSRRR